MVHLEVLEEHHAVGVGTLAFRLVDAGPVDVAKDLVGEFLEVRRPERLVPLLQVGVGGEGMALIPSSE